MEEASSNSSMLTAYFWQDEPDYEHARWLDFARVGATVPGF